MIGVCWLLVGLICMYIQLRFITKIEGNIRISRFRDILVIILPHHYLSKPTNIISNLSKHNNKNTKASTISTVVT